MKTLRITNMTEMSQILGTNLNKSDYTTLLDDIDDDFGDVSLNFNNATTPELPHRDFNIATLTPEKLKQLRKSSE